MAKTQKVIVSKRSVIARINRCLAKDSDDVLKISRSARMKVDVGEYYLLDCRVGGVSGKNVDPEAYARDIGVLQPYEQMGE